jgi:tetratricopeptide (TPR) repeat protein
MLPRELHQVSFGVLVRYLRKKNDLTQSKLASKAACSIGYVSEIERGEIPRRQIAELLVTALDPLDDERAALWAAYARATTDRATGKVVTSAPVSPVSPVSPFGPLIAREGELERLSAALQMALRAVPRMVVLSGEPGIGKTRLALEAMERARAAGMLTAQRQCYEQQHVVAFAPFVELLEQVYRAVPGDLRRKVPSRWPMMRPLLPDGMRAAVASTLPGPGATGSSDVQRLFWQIMDFLRAACLHQPVALFLDDIQWADEASLYLLQYLLRHLDKTRIMLLVTYRDTEVSRLPLLRGVLHPLEKQRLAERLVLPPLTATQTTELLNAYLPNGTIAPDVSDLIYESAGGVPYTSTQLLQGLRERGQLVAEGSVWQRVGTENLDLPASILDEIREHVQRLRPFTQAVLRDASVLGQVFMADTLRLMGVRPLDVVEDALAEAITAGLVRDARHDGYRFRHALVQDAILKEHWESRREVHRRAAEALRYAPPRRGHAADIALHFREGDDIPQALSYTLKAGDEAEATYAHAEAEAHFRLAIELARELGKAAEGLRAREKLGAVLIGTSRFTDAIEALAQCEQTYRAKDDLEGLARVMAQIGWAHAFSGTPDKGIALVAATVERVSRRTPGSSDEPVPPVSPVSLAHLYTAQALLYFVTSRFSDQLAATELACAAARETGDPRLLARSEFQHVTALYGVGQIDEGLRILESILGLLEESDDHLQLIFALFTHSHVHEIRGEFGRCFEILDHALAMSKQANDPGTILVALAKRGWIAFLAGKLEQARTDLEQAVKCSMDVADFWGTAYAPMAMGTFCLATGQIAEAREHLQRAVADGEYHHDRQVLRLAHAALAEDDLLHGRPAAARTRLEPLLDVPGQWEMDVTAFLWLLAWSHLDLGDDQRAENVIEQSIERARTQTYRRILPDALRVKAMLAMRQAQWALASDALAEALDLSRAMPYPYAEAKVLYTCGQLARERGDPAQAHEHFEQALTILNRLGERLYAERIECDLADLTALH